MSIQEQIMESLDKLLVPGVMCSSVKMILIREIKVIDHTVGITIASAALVATAIYRKLTRKCTFSATLGDSEPA